MTTNAKANAPLKVADMPKVGGCYRRDKDGRLTAVDGPAKRAADEAAPTPAKPKKPTSLNPKNKEG